MLCSLSLGEYTARSSLSPGRCAGRPVHRAKTVSKARMSLVEHSSNPATMNKSVQAPSRWQDRSSLIKFTIRWHINTFIARILCQLNSEPNESHAVVTPLILCDNPVQVVQPSAIQGEMPESVCFEVFLPLMADRAPVASRRRCGLGARDHGLPLPWGSLCIR